MEDRRTTKPRSKAQVDGKSADRRTPRTIRFTDSEWANVSQAAAAANISTATFARNAVLEATAEPAAASGGPLPPGLLELVKRTYRSAYILSTLKRDDMIWRTNSLFNQPYLNKMDNSFVSPRVVVFGLITICRGSTQTQPMQHSSGRWLS